MRNRVNDNILQAHNILGSLYGGSPDGEKLSQIAKALDLFILAWNWDRDEKLVWQNIDTSPKDGTLILVKGFSGGSHEHYTVSAYWDSSRGGWLDVGGGRLSETWPSRPTKWRKIT